MDDQPEAVVQDVYATGWPEFSADLPLLATGMVVLLEPGPGALARVFALLGTLGLVPVAASSSLTAGDAIRLDLQFDEASAGRLDLLRRKLTQLVDCLDLTLTNNRQRAVG